THGRADPVPEARSAVDGIRILRLELDDVLTRDVVPKVAQFRILPRGHEVAVQRADRSPADDSVRAEDLAVGDLLGEPEVVDDAGLIDAASPSPAQAEGPVESSGVI